MTSNIIHCLTSLPATKRRLKSLHLIDTYVQHAFIRSKTFYRPAPIPRSCRRSLYRCLIRKTHAHCKPNQITPNLSPISSLPRHMHGYTASQKATAAKTMLATTIKETGMEAKMPGFVPSDPISTRASSDRLLIVVLVPLVSLLSTVSSSCGKLSGLRHR